MLLVVTLLALRGDPNNGCEGDYVKCGRLSLMVPLIQ